MANTPNVLDYVDLFQTQLDEQLLQDLTSAWMEPNASLVRYIGGDTVKIPKITTDGLGNYSRTDGFDGLSGAVNLSWETRTLSMDRAKEFNIDSQDVDETGFVAAAGNVMGVFQKTKVAPEVDAYRYSKIFSLSNAALKTGAYTPAVGTVFSTLKGHIKDIQDVVGENANLVICISYGAADLLDRSTEYTHTREMVDFSASGLVTKVPAIDGIPLIRVPSTRFKSAFTFSSTNGFSASSVAMNLNWIILPRSAAIAIVKTDKLRIFSPDTNQKADAWLIQYRKYHDLWMLDNVFDAVYVSYTSIAAPALAITITKPTTSGKTKWSPDVVVPTGETLAYKMQAAAGSDLYNDIPTGTTAYTAGTEISATAGQHMLCYQLDATGHIVKYVDHTLVSGDIGTGS